MLNNIIKETQNAFELQIKKLLEKAGVNVNGTLEEIKEELIRKDINLRCENNSLLDIKSYIVSIHGVDRYKINVTTHISSEDDVNKAKIFVSDIIALNIEYY